MAALVHSRAVLAALLALAAARVDAAVDTGVCVADSGGEYAQVAEAARRALGVPSQRLDVTEKGQRDQLSSRCGKLIVAVGPQAARSATALAPRTPLVDVMAGGARPEGAFGVSADADPRRVLETLRTMAPRVKRVGAVYDPARTGPPVAEAEEAARSLGIELVALPARTIGEAVRAFYRFEGELRVDALWLLPDGTTTVQEK